MTDQTMTRVDLANRGGGFVIVDEEDAARVRQHEWWYSTGRDGPVSVHRTIQVDGVSTRMLLANYILGPGKWRHRNPDQPLNYRRSNLVSTEKRLGAVNG